ncbi:hypothetical protein [Enorma phocaeensis]|uniref:Uncharacterized protein n=1 Tax=Enorma phocaeensis TaxID=1871019 RepID=A0A921IT86_9ACTN|nr:hypothetical protein [Enorma phocaeensis]
MSNIELVKDDDQTDAFVRTPDTRDHSFQIGRFRMTSIEHNSSRRFAKRPRYALEHRAVIEPKHLGAYAIEFDFALSPRVVLARAACKP